MCDFCNKKNVSPKEYGYFSEIMNMRIKVRLCDECARKLKEKKRVI